METPLSVDHVPGNERRDARQHGCETVPPSSHGGDAVRGFASRRSELLVERPSHVHDDTDPTQAVARAGQPGFNTGIGYRRSHQPTQSTATSRASQTSRILESAKRPTRSTSTPIETLSTESRFTAERWEIGSSPGSRTTSLARPRMVVVHGATSARRSRGIAASRDRTTTGRRPTSPSSHHHTSPRVGSVVTTLQRPV